jgi:hypothetical protein
MKVVQAELEQLPPLCEEKKTWQPNWAALMTLADKAVEPAIKTLLSCSAFSVKAALKGTRSARPPKRRAQGKNQAALGVMKDEEGPLSQEDQSINATTAVDKAPPPLTSLAEVKPVKKKMGADVKKAVKAEGLGENAALLPADEADMTSLASKKLIWTLLEIRWFKNSSDEIYRAHHSINGSWNGQKMRYVNLAYVPFLMLCCLSHLGES